LSFNFKSFLEEAFNYHKQGKLNQAIEKYEFLINKNIKDINLFKLYGLSLLQIGKLEESKKYLIKALEINPSSPTILSDLAIVHKNLKQFDVALDCINKSLKFDNLNLKTLLNKANLLFEIGNFNEAISVAKDVQKIDKNINDVYKILGLSYLKLSKFDEAKINLDLSLKANDQDFYIYFCYGEYYREIKNYELAIENYSTSLRLNNNFIPALANRSICLLENSNFDLALDDINNCIDVENKNYLLYDIKANILINKGKIDDGIKCFKKSIELNPYDRNIKFNLAETLLRQKNFEDGLVLYENRAKETLGKNKNLYKKKNLLDHKGSIKNNKILVFSEQGLGDNLNFFRYLELLLKKEAKVLFKLNKNLINFFKNSKLNIDYISNDDEYQDYDFHIPLMSLPLYFDQKIDNIPKTNKYFYFDSKKINDFKVKNIPVSDNKLNIGLAFSGNPKYKKDHKRSIKLNELNKIFDLKINYYVLQRDVNKDDLEFIKKKENIFYQKEDLEDLEKTALICSSMDLVISVDTSIAHLSGCLGNKTILLLQNCADFRWFNKIDYSYWYDDFKIFRQTNECKWQPVIDDLVKYLKFF